jgi:hypothetical protein
MTTFAWQGDDDLPTFDGYPYLVSRFASCWRLPSVPEPPSRCPAWPSRPETWDFRNAERGTVA